VVRCRYALVLCSDAFITAQLLEAGADVRATAARYLSRPDHSRTHLCIRMYVCACTCV
jgi:hypothetical protein